MFQMVVSVCSGTASIITLLLLIIKPIREKLWGMHKVNDALKCSLRQDMLHTYYTCKGTKTIRQYEKENYLKCYEAYTAMHGNSFIEDITKEVREWEVIT